MAGWWEEQMWEFHLDDLNSKLVGHSAPVLVVLWMVYWMEELLESVLDLRSALQRRALD